MKDALVEDANRVVACCDAPEVANCPDFGGIVDLGSRQAGATRAGRLGSTVIAQELEVAYEATISFVYEKGLTSRARTTTCC